MMNFDDEFTKKSEETFQKYLEKIRSIPIENFKEIEESMLVVTNFLDDLKNKPEKSADDLQLISNFSLDLKDLFQKIEDMKLILDISLYRQSLAFYENVKKLAKEGDKQAEIIYNDLRHHFEKFDPN